MYGNSFCKNYILLTLFELVDLRQRLNITCITADHLFDLPEGTYEMFESGYRIQSIQEDNIIRMTQCFDENGRNFIPLRMQIQRN